MYYITLFNLFRAVFYDRRRGYIWGHMSIGKKPYVEYAFNIYHIKPFHHFDVISKNVIKYRTLAAFLKIISKYTLFINTY